MNFIALDVETANADQASICSVGLAHFRDGEHVETERFLINPEDYFDPFHIFIHGIADEHVASAPKMPDLYGRLSTILADAVVVHHTHFDRVAFRRVAEKYGLPPIAGRWLDSAKVARRTWVECAYAGYGLPDLSDMLGFEFEHHEAGEDARAAGVILMHAIQETGRPLEEWFQRVEQPLGWDPSERSRPVRAGRELPGRTIDRESIAFTGKLEQMERSEGADLAAAAGFNVEPGVTKNTTILVVGVQHLRALRGGGKSAKHLKAEKLSAAGQAIRIIGEADFLELIRQSEASET